MFNFVNKNLADETGIKNAFLIQGVNAFIAGIIYIILPLLMLERGISIESMGLVFSVLPLVSQTNRLLFGAASDYIGRKKFFWVNGLMNLTFLGTYCLARTPFGFVAGKISEGIKNASLWSVNRAYFLDHTKESEKVLIKMRGVNSTFRAVGILLAGFLVTKLFYDKTLLLLMGVSFLIFPNVKMLIDKKRYRISVLSILRALDFRNKSKQFKNFVAIFFLIGLSWGFSDSYIFPLFLKEMGISVESMGLLLGIRILLVGIFTYLFNSIWSNKNKILIGGLLTSLLLLILPLSNKTTIPFLIVLLGTVGGIGVAGREAIFTEVADHNSLGADIGILMIGTHVGMSISQALSGFVITSFGFSVVFFAAAILYALFSLAAFYNMD